MAKISVIVPVYNVEDFIRECIESILSQTFCDFELILVDDGSYDRSGKICDEYSKRDVRVKVFHKKNEGVSCARNFGIKHATGEWICFVDSDDYIDVNHLEAFFYNYKKGDDLLMCGHVCHYTEMSTTKTETFSIPYTLNKIDDIIYDSEENNIINSPVCKLFKHSIIMEHGLLFDTNTSYGEDHLFVLSYCMYVENISFTKKTTYHYIHRRRLSLTNAYTNSDRYVYYFIQLVKIYSKLITSHNWFTLRKKIPKIISGHGVMAVISIFKDDRDTNAKHANFSSVYCGLNKFKSIQVNCLFQKIIICTFWLPQNICYFLCQVLCELRMFFLKEKCKNGKKYS